MLLKKNTFISHGEKSHLRIMATSLAAAQLASEDRLYSRDRVTIWGNENRSDRGCFGKLAPQPSLPSTTCLWLKPRSLRAHCALSSLYSTSCAGMLFPQLPATLYKEPVKGLHL